MKRLLPLRHASSWKDRDLADHERPLALRGRRAARRLANHLRRESAAPALVLCSSARRARETFELIGPGLGERVVVRVEPELYAASDQRLLERLRALEEGVDSVLLIGHNPGCERLVLSLAADRAELAAVRHKHRWSARDARIRRPLARARAAPRDP